MPLEWTQRSGHFRGSFWAVIRPLDIIWGLGMCQGTHSFWGPPSIEHLGEVPGFGTPSVEPAVGTLENG